MRAVRIMVIIILLIGVIGAGYVLPRLAGDRFASALIRLDLVEAKNGLCPDTSLGQITSFLGSGNAFGIWVSQQIGSGIQVPGWSELVKHVRLESSYNPLGSVYTVSYVIDQTVVIGGLELRGGVKTPPLMLNVRRLAPLSFCLSVV